MLRQILSFFKKAKKNPEPIANIPRGALLAIGAMALFRYYKPRSIPTAETGKRILHHPVQVSVGDEGFSPDLAPRLKVIKITETSGGVAFTCEVLGGGTRTVTHTFYPVRNEESPPPASG